VAYHPIENYGIVGDLHTVALIAENGSIDFMCFPRFDSPTIFARLLDNEKGGCFNIHPVLEGVRHKQLYLPDSNVLVSRFLSEQGVAEVSDFMLIEESSEARTLVRRARTVRRRSQVPNALRTPIRLGSRRCAPSGTSNAFPDRAISARRGSCPKECWVMPITSGCTQRNWDLPGNTWAIFRRLLCMWH